MKKYPRTPHLPFSDGLQNDDRLCDTNDLLKLIASGTEFVITEKLDGGCTAMKASHNGEPGGVFARSHVLPTFCPTFNYVKSVHYAPNKALIEKDGLMVFGENLFAIHSVVYTKLTDYFYMFGIMDQVTEEFFSWDMVEAYAEEMNMKTAPVVYEGTIESLEWLEKFINEQMNAESALGGEKEGFVIRVRNAFQAEEFEHNVFKWVRANHIATPDQHWRRNWKQAAKLVK